MKLIDALRFDLAGIICWFRGHRPKKTKWSILIEILTHRPHGQCDRCGKIIKLEETL